MPEKIGLKFLVIIPILLLVFIVCGAVFWAEWLSVRLQRVRAHLARKLSRSEKQNRIEEGNEPAPPPPEKISRLRRSSESDLRDAVDQEAVLRV